MSKIKIAIIGLAHMHISMLSRSLAQYPDEAEFIGWADVPPMDGQGLDKRAEALGDLRKNVPYFADWRELAALKPDLALCCPDNAASGDVACYLLERGIHVVLEKPMTIDYADAIRVRDAAEKSGCILAVNWPIAWFPTFNKAKELCDAGRIGEIMRVIYRSPATWGPFSYSKDGSLPPIDEMAETWWYQPERGGGSILDYACYGAALSTWFFGRQAERVWGIKHNFMLPGLDCEDFSAMLLDFGCGIGQLEGSWSTYNSGQVPSGPVIHGKEGTIVCDRHSNQVKVYLGRSHASAAPSEVIDCPVSVSGLNFGRNILDAIVKGAALHPLLEPALNVSVMAALDAGRWSAEQGGVATEKL
ncbi:MAG: Gfo/Idh/MocA family oxidoreductase [Clostridia bacterium]|nr:Gfo/Idh/MocA family oxidoreductase [Clostridia bacterium]